VSAVSCSVHCLSLAVVPGDLLLMYKDAAMTSECTPLSARIIGE